MERAEGREGLDELERAERRRRVLVIAVAAIVVGAAIVYVFVPRTLASGEIDDAPWRIRAAPVSFDDAVRLAIDGDLVLEEASEPNLRGVGHTTVWHVGDPAFDGETLLAGPTPDGVSSIRVTVAGASEGSTRSGEASLHRVGWRTFHVDRLPGHVEVLELVAFDADGRPTQLTDDGVTPAG